MEFIIIIAILALSALPQMLVRSQFSKYSRVQNDMLLTGAQVAQAMMDDANISAQILPCAGQLTDHYDPRNNSLNLSETVYGQDSVAAISVAAHEVGHLMQKEEGYVPMKIRSALVPVANLGSMLSMPLVLIGLMLGYMNLSMLGIYVFMGVLAFQLVTLPVEFDASSRALRCMSERGYITEEERPMVKKVLNAAALTYVAAAIASALQVIRMFLLTRRRH